MCLHKNCFLNGGTYLLSALNSQSKTQLLIREYQGIERTDEPVTTGIPFPKGQVHDLSSLCLINEDGVPQRFQSSVLATWPDHSLKWVLFDFKANVAAHETLIMSLENTIHSSNDFSETSIKSEECEEYLVVDTGAAIFTIDRKKFRPFVSVKIGDHEMIDPEQSIVQLIDKNQIHYESVIDHLHWETDGPLRKTLKIDGHFPDTVPDGRPVQFTSRIFFYYNKRYARIDFSLLNPNAAKHYGGLWDLGDPGSYLFSDLTICISLINNNKPVLIDCVVKEDTTHSSNPIENNKAYERACGTHLNIYQDSSGGENWNCSNHVNRDNEVRHRFKGFRLYSDNQLLYSGRRALPVITVKNERNKIKGTIKNFWQNFPNALEGKGRCLFFRLFPGQYDDFYELQGGERKTHSVYIDFSLSDDDTTLDWIEYPLIASADPTTYAEAGVFPYLVPDTEIENIELLALVNTAIEGDRSFFKRREMIDEYGWRNFGELYADHEKIDNNDDKPFISHYNNQYDCINGFLSRYAASGDFRWFLLADQLCAHVKDIDIYHTEHDRPEFNHGLFWHTNHHMEAKTSTHRCYSKLHVDLSQVSNYGGGPALSHCYTTGLLNHYYMTGDVASKESVLLIADFVVNNYKISRLTIIRFANFLKRIKSNIKNGKIAQQRVNTNKIYNLNGPGRASGNAINSLIDAVVVSGDLKYLRKIEEIIKLCISPEDRINDRDLMDIENRWMYTVFLQALIKYSLFKQSLEQIDQKWFYSNLSLLEYSRWMASNEMLYLDQIEKLDFPNETWSAQDFRKVCILQFALNNSKEENDAKLFLMRSEFLFKKALEQYNQFDTRFLARPLILIINNALQYLYMRIVKEGHSSKHEIKKRFRSFIIPNFLTGYSFLMEWKYLKWHIICFSKRLRR